MENLIIVIVTFSILKKDIMGLLPTPFQELTKQETIETFQLLLKFILEILINLLVISKIGKVKVNMKQWKSKMMK